MACDADGCRLIAAGDALNVPGAGDTAGDAAGDAEDEGKALALGDGAGVVSGGGEGGGVTCRANVRMESAMFTRYYYYDAGSFPNA